MTTLPEVSHGDILAASEALCGVVRETPVLRSKVLSDLAGGPVWLKCEHLQRAGSFKIRGAYWRISRLTEAERARGVVAASAGNHAQGVALAASILGTRATVVMPQNAQLPKLAATRAYGADVVLYGDSIIDALAKAREIADADGSIFIHPFEHPDIIAGQGTVGLEIAAQCPQARTVIVPVGGGGLMAGIALALAGRPADAKPHPANLAGPSDPVDSAGSAGSAASPGSAGSPGWASSAGSAGSAGSAPVVVGVQAAAVAPFPASLTAGRPVGVTPAPTMADGIAVAVPGEITFRMISELVSQVLTVTEESLSRALLLCLERAKQVVEPAGAAGVAALLEHPGAFEPPVVVVLSGGNIDPLVLAKVLRFGLTAAGRYLALRCRVPDRPGSLAGLLAEVAALGSSVLDVLHERASPGLRIDEVEISLQLETRGPEHCAAIVAALTGAGYAVEVI